MAKTKVDDINRNIYDVVDKDNYEFKMQKGLNREIVEEISKRKKEPDWMLDIRLKALEMYNKLELPTWGPDLSELKMDEIATYVKPKANLNNSWDDVPEDIKNTFERLGIPEAERKTLAGVGLGVTSSGYQFKYKDIWFNAGSYGMVRMVASDYNFPIGTIVKIKDNNTGEEYKAIVLDRGDRNIGLDSKYIFDLVSETTIAARYYGIHRNIDVEVLHVGTRSDLKNIQNYGHL